MLSNVFRILGIFLLGLSMYFILNNLSTARQPALETALKFLTAVQDQDAAAAKELVIPGSTQLIAAGSRLNGVSFSEMSIFGGAFSKSPRVDWTSLDLSALKIPRDARVAVVEKSGLATVNSDNGTQIIMKKWTDGAWRILYIAPPTNNSQ